MAISTNSTRPRVMVDTITLLARTVWPRWPYEVLQQALRNGFEFSAFFMTNIRTKRVYEPANPHDGLRVLVDRVWPRGMTKEQIQADMWLKDVAPSIALRKWFGHDRSKWKAFKSRYFVELDAKPEVVVRLLDEATKERLTLLFSARDTEYNRSVALREYLLSRSKKRAS